MSVQEKGRFVHLRCDKSGCARRYMPRPAIRADSISAIFPRAKRAGWLCAAVPGKGNRWAWEDLCPSHAKAVRK